MFHKPKIFISKCIEFEHCRWNAAIINSPVVAKLKKHVECITACPEKEIGLGIPRKSIRLVKKGRSHCLMQNETGKDITDEMKHYTEKKIALFKNMDGFILKDRSPSCGVKGIKVYPDIGKVIALPEKGEGFFGGAIAEKFSYLPIENEGRLTNFSIREYFYTCIYTTASFRNINKKKSMKALVDFHSKNKFLFMSYNQTVMRHMGKVVANHESLSLAEVYARYEMLLYKMFMKQPRYTSNINVLMHGLGYFSKDLNAKEKSYFLNTLEKYRSGKVPLSVCNSILLSWIERFDNSYLREQTFFMPYPEELLEVTDSGKGRKG